MGEDDLGTDEFSKRLKGVFHGALRAVSEKDDFDFYVIPQVLEVKEGGDVLLAIFPSATKEFRLDITDIEEDGEQWLVTTPKQRWSFRQIPEKDLKPFKAEMRKLGMNV